MTQERRSFDEEVNSAVETFNRVNWQAMTSLGFDNSRGTVLYDYQVEFMYLIDTITRDSKFIANKTLPRLRALISEYRDDLKRIKEEKAKKED